MLFQRYDKFSNTNSFPCLSASNIFCNDVPINTIYKMYVFFKSNQVICANEYALIQGLPGTGKTSTTTFLTRLLVARGKRVLLTSYTHSAVDNLLLKLKASGMRNDSLIRIGQESSIHSGIHDLLFPNADDSQQSAWDLQKRMSNARVVGVTALTIPKTPYINGQHFDFVIIDEAGQINQPATLGAIVAADQFVLVGDHEQLPPIVESTLPEQKGKQQICEQTLSTTLDAFKWHY